MDNTPTLHHSNTPVLRIQLIGGLQVAPPGKDPAPFPTHRSRVLLAYLAYFRRQSHPREFLAEMLWPGGNPDAIRLRLNQTVAELRRAVGGEDILISDRFTLRLDPTVTTDVEEFFAKTRLAKTEEDPETRFALLAEAVELVDAELLPGFYEDWIAEAREALSEALQSALEELSDLSAQAGKLNEAIDYAKRAVAANRYNDPLQLKLLRLLLKAKRQTEAIHHYDLLKAMYREDFAVDPSDEIVSLMRPQIALSRRAGTLPEAAPAPARPQQRPQRGDSRLVDHALETYIEVGDAERAMRLAALLLPHWNLMGELVEARRSLKRALSMPQAIFAPADARASALIALGFAAMSVGYPDEARAALQGALSLAKSLGNERLSADAQRFLGTMAVRQGKPQEGQAHSVKSIVAYKRIGDKGGASDALTSLGEALRFQGELEEAEKAHREARKLRLELGRLDRAAQSALNLGILASRRGNYPAALPLLREALEQARTVGGRTVVADGLMEIAGVCAETGDPHRAARLLGAVVSLRERIKVPIPEADRPDYVRFLKRARQALTREAFNLEWEKGGSQSLEDSIALALAAKSIL